MANPPFRVSPNCLGLPFSLSVRELKDCIVKSVLSVLQAKARV